MEGYCFKCRAKREIKNPAQLKMKNGRVRTEGTCHICNTKISTLGKA